MRRETTGLALTVGLLMATGGCAVGEGTQGSSGFTSFGDDGTSGGTEDGEEQDTGAVPELPETGTNVVFRIHELSLRDPHAFYVPDPEDPEPGCEDGTVFMNLGLLQGPINDGELDLLMLFPEFDAALDTMPLEVMTGECLPADAPTGCDDAEGGADRVSVVAQNDLYETCFEADADTLNPEYANPNAPSGPCFASAAATFELVINGPEGIDLILPLQDGRISAEFAEQSLVDGTLAGFVTQADATAIELDLEDYVPGGGTLWDLIAGGGGCQTEWDDTDVHPELGNGVWFYFGFEAERLDWTGE